MKQTKYELTSFRAVKEDHEKVIELTGTLRKELKKNISVSQLYRIASCLLLENLPLVKKRIEQETLEAN